MARGEIARQLAMFEAQRCLHSWRHLVRATGELPPLARAFAVLVNVVLFTWLFMAVALSHGRCVDWGYPTGHMVVTWVLWGLGGALPVMGALLTAPIDLSRLQGGRVGLATLTFARLLPITEGDALRAKATGATLAYLVWLAAGTLVLAVARGLMAGWDLMETLPSLLDPWAVASTLAFGCVLVGTLQADVIVRRHGPATQTLFTILVIAYALAMGTAVVGLGFMPVKPWGGAAGAAILAFAIVAASATMLRRSRAGGFRPRLQVSDSQAERTPWWNDLPVRADALLGLGVAWAPAWRPVSRHRLAQTAAFAVLVIGAGILVSSATMVGTWLWHTGGSAGSPLSISAVDYIQMAAGIPALLAALIMIAAPLIAWQHFDLLIAKPSSTALLNRAFRLPHMAALLPVHPGAGWRARLVGVLVLAMVIIPAAILGDMATVSVGRMLGVFGDTLLRPAVPLALAATLLFSLVGFAFVPLLRRASQFIELNGLLFVGFVTGYVGLMFGSLTAIGSAYLSVPKLPAPWYAILLFPALMLWLSYRGHDARMWPLRRDGTPSARARLAAWLLPVLIGLAGAWTGHLLTHVMDIFRN